MKTPKKRRKKRIYPDTPVDPKDIARAIFAKADRELKERKCTKAEAQHEGRQNLILRRKDRF